MAGPALVLGDADGSLPFSRQEAQAVADLYGESVYLGEAAQERLVWEQGPQAGILHLASHGLYDPVNPNFSHISLAGDPGGAYDGLLETHEIYNLNLGQADLVVLSACESGRGLRVTGDEIIGLNRAFLYAGTPSVLSSLWNVEDLATHDLMIAFYSRLRQGYNKAAALRMAQLEMLQQPATAHPYFWASFVLIGDTGAGRDFPARGTLGVLRSMESSLVWAMAAVLGAALGGGLGGGLAWARRRRALAQQALLARRTFLLDAQQRLQAEPANKARARALQHIARELHTIERRCRRRD